MPSKYAEAGVDVRKRGIETFKETLDDLYPQAFCVVTRDPDMPEYGIVTHTDSAGSKPIQAYIHWRETGEIRWFKGLAQDVIAMNLDDIICVGAKPVNFVDYIAVNPFKIPKGELLKTINEGFKECLSLLEEYGLKTAFSGGETADMPDQLRTLDISGTINGRVKLSKVITGDGIKPGDLIVGLRSGGKTRYEDCENSGIMCNGLTLARLCLMDEGYQRVYPEVSTEERGYYGRFKFDQYLDELGMTVGEAILSPTRLFAPVVWEMLTTYGPQISGLVHNTAGGQTKCLRIGRNIHYVKDDLFEADPIFHLIQRESGESWRDMFENYNMGVGFEVIVDREYAEELIAISERYGLEAKVIGRCERSDGKNKLTIISPYGKFRYS